MSYVESLELNSFVLYIVVVFNANKVDNTIIGFISSYTAYKVISQYDPHSC